MTYLYHVNFGNFYIPKKLEPYVPFCVNYTDIEEPFTPRISLAPSIEHCLTAISVIGRLDDEEIPYNMTFLENDEKKVTLDEPYTFRVYRFLTETLEGAYFYKTEHLIQNHFVYDAAITQEHWYLKDLPIQESFDVTLHGFYCKLMRGISSVVNFTDSERKVFQDDFSYDAIYNIDMNIKPVQEKSIV